MSVDQANHSNLIWKISGALSAMIIVAAAFMYLQAQDKAPPAEVSPPIVQKKLPEPSISPEPIEPAVPEPVQEEQKVLVTDTILTEDVPNNPSLAKEEIDRLQDIQEQLLTQQTMLAEQEKDAEELIKLKEEQIEILEQQLMASN